ncbi:MAG: DUF1684 domain-containing protein [Terracidiphilus sp.]
MTRGWTRGQRWTRLLFLAQAISFAALGLLAGGPVAAQTSVTSAESEWLQDLDTWRARRAQEVDAPDGWLTLAGLEWLKPGANSMGAAPGNQVPVHAQAPDRIGLFTVSGKTVQLLSPQGGFPADLMIDGQPAREGPLAVGAKPSVISWHGLSMVVLDRGGRYAVRIKDAVSATRKGFRGLNWYAPDPQFSVEARWIPFTPPHIELIPTGIGTTLDLPAPGVAEFTLAGRKLTLEPVLESPGDQTLLFILSDETGKLATYAGGRYLHAPFPDHGLGKPGKLILDFNRMENPACAYTPYATCPQPPEKNRLPVAIEAGEKRYAP